MVKEATMQINSIPDTQNQDAQLKRLAAQRQLYSRAKVVFTIQVMLTVVVAIISSILALYFPGFRAWASFIGLSISLLDATVLETQQKRLKQQAAKVQESFDCKTLGLDWQDTKVGSPVDYEVIEEYAGSHRRKHPNYSGLRDWYPQCVGGVPLHVARFICQRANCWWDAALRRRYATAILIFLVVLPFSLLVIGLARGASIETFVLAIYAPLSPAFLWGIREFNKQRDTAVTLDRLKSKSEELWAKATIGGLSPDQFNDESRKLQDEIYDHRRNAPLIFDWLYRLLRKRGEQSMNRAAEELVKDYIEKKKH